ADDPRPATGFGQVQEAAGTPGGFVGQADTADLAGAPQVVQYLQSILYGTDLLLGVVLVAELAVEVRVPVKLIALTEIDVLGLQALHVAVQSSDVVLAGEAGGDVTDALHVAVRGGGRVGQHPLVTIATLAKVLADDALASPLAFAPGRYRV